MISLPVLRQLSVLGYGLYPGRAGEPNLHVSFEPGLTLILGANGIGKTTLISIIYRLLVGPTDLTNVSAGATFGSPRTVRILSRPERRTFANRVVDDAVNATATLTFSLGDTAIQVTRALSNLEIRGMSVGESHADATEDSFQRTIQSLAGLSSFSDWIFLLRHLTFYFEDRRALVWDPTAQRQLLRLLFLDLEASREWSDREREILTLDSDVRNLQYALTREERRIEKLEQATDRAPEIRQQLSLLRQLQDTESEQLFELEETLLRLDAHRQEMRLSALTADQAHESAMRAVERLQLSAISASFPSATETAKYLIGQLLADTHCLACESEVPAFARLLQRRIAGSECVVCGSNVPGVKQPTRHAARVLTKALKELEASETRRIAASAERDASLAEYDETVTQISKLVASTARRSADMDDLVRRLPPDDQAIHQQRSDLLAMRGRVASGKEKLEELRSQFSTLTEGVVYQVSLSQEEVKRAFDSFATDFLVEGCELKWSPRSSKVGEFGAKIEFPAFDIEMTGGNFASPVRRGSPEQVSESQREFIDLAFRMALMRVATPMGGTLVIDAPESSLDAVFVSRAARVLTRYGSANSNNRLLITSNLVDGNLIPELLSRTGIRSLRDPRIVDLFEVAEPTAATRRLDQEYAKVKRRLFARARALR